MIVSSFKDKKTQVDDICKAGQGIGLILLNSAMCLSVPRVKGTSLILVTKPLRATEHVKTFAYSLCLQAQLGKLALTRRPFSSRGHWCSMKVSKSSRKELSCGHSAGSWHQSWLVSSFLVSGNPQIVSDRVKPVCTIKGFLGRLQMSSL